MLPRTQMHSPYMEYAKLRSGAKYNLATSGVMSFPLAELPVSIDDLEINGPTIYGYAPLQERIARYNQVRLTVWWRRRDVDGKSSGHGRDF